MAEAVVPEGPALETSPPAMMEPPTAGAAIAPPGVPSYPPPMNPQYSVPPAPAPGMAPPTPPAPRLVPLPQQAQPVPYTPTYREWR